MRKVGQNEQVAIARVLKFARCSVFLGEIADLADAIVDAAKWVGRRYELDLRQQDELASAALEASRAMAA